MSDLRLIPQEVKLGGVWRWNVVLILREFGVLKCQRHLKDSQKFNGRAETILTYWICNLNDLEFWDFFRTPCHMADKLHLGAK